MIIFRYDCLRDCVGDFSEFLNIYKLHNVFTNLNIRVEWLLLPLILTYLQS